MMFRLHFCKAIAYEDEAVANPDGDTVKMYGDAYKHYKMAYVLSREIQGAEHSLTVEYLDALQEPTYKWFADNKQEDVARLSLEQVERDLRSA
jgi:hypothetical protein